MTADGFLKAACEDPQSPPDIPTDRPTPARIYDYYLGGKDNFAVDREAAEQILTIAPETPAVARENRAFLGRAVRYLAAEAGIRQFIDLGSGLPTQDNVHQLAQRLVPQARVVYVDDDPIVLSHGRAILAENERTTVITADMRDPESILTHPDTRRLIDFTRPWALLLVSVLHFLPDSDTPHDIITTFRDHMPPGSHLALSHISAGPVNPDLVDDAKEVYSRAGTALTPRTPERIGEFFTGFRLIDPGLELVMNWRPDHAATTTPGRGLPYGGVGRLG